MTRTNSARLAKTPASTTHERQSVGKAARAATILFMVVAMLGVAADQATAAPSTTQVSAGTQAAVTATWSRCPDNNMCGFEHDNGGGRYIYMVIGCSDFRSCFSSNFNDVTSSLWNRTPYTWCFYTNIHYGGERYSVPRGMKISSLGRLNDLFSSAHRC